MSEILNPAVIEELLSITGEEDPELLLDLIDLFLEDAPRKLDDIQQALDTQDNPRLMAAAHTLKGTAGTLGLDFVYNECLELEAAGGEGLESSCVQVLQQKLKDGCVALEDLRLRYA